MEDLKKYQELRYEGKELDENEFISFLVRYSEPTEFKPNVDDAWSNLSLSLEQRSNNSNVLLRVAASIILVCGIAAAYFFLNQSPELIHISSTEQVLDYALPDGSKVTLRSMSSISFPESFNDRDISLSGTAYFEVASSEDPFTVQFGNSKIEVRGTAFLIEDLKDKAHVYVSEGSVEYRDDKQKIVLTPGDEIWVDKNSSELVSAKNVSRNQIAWATKTLNFDGTPLKTVIRDLENYFEVKITLDPGSLKKCTFTGNFEDPELDYLLETLAKALNLTLNKKANTYQLSGSGC